LVRLGIGRFHIADFDTFDLQNFNRQAGAFNSTLDQSKCEVMKAMALDINPELEIKTFEGVDEHNFKAFFEGVDIYVDGLDFFVLDVREKLFAFIHKNKIPGVTFGPLGMGAAGLNILPQGMSFEDYFGLSKAKDQMEKAILFALGLAPSGGHISYVADPTRVDFVNQKVPSTPMGCQLAAGVVGTEALKILLERGRVGSAPQAFQFDAYKNKLYHTWTPGGYKNPLQKLRFFMARKKIHSMTQKALQNQV